VNKGKIIKNKLDKWANESYGNKLSYMEEDIGPEDLEGLNEEEK